MSGDCDKHFSRDVNRREDLHTHVDVANLLNSVVHCLFKAYSHMNWKEGRTLRRGVYMSRQFNLEGCVYVYNVGITVYNVEHLQKAQGM